MKGKKFVPYGKMSKKQRREQDLKQRKGWGGLNPVTRTAPNGKKPPDHEKHPESYEGIRIK